ncbi:MAG: hypothetical protein Q9227_007684 [Pyrenula ochraceoflavens]
MELSVVLLFLICFLREALSAPAFDIFDSLTGNPGSPVPFEKYPKFQWNRICTDFGKPNDLTKAVEALFDSTIQALNAPPGQQEAYMILCPQWHLMYTNKDLVSSDEDSVRQAQHNFLVTSNGDFRNLKYVLEGFSGKPNGNTLGFIQSPEFELGIQLLLIAAGAIDVAPSSKWTKLGIGKDEIAGTPMLLTRKYEFYGAQQRKKNLSNKDKNTLVAENYVDIMKGVLLQMHGYAADQYDDDAPDFVDWSEGGVVDETTFLPGQKGDETKNIAPGMMQKQLAKIDFKPRIGQFFDDIGLNIGGRGSAQVMRATDAMIAKLKLPAETRDMLQPFLDVLKGHAGDAAVDVVQAGTNMLKDRANQAHDDATKKLYDTKAAKAQAVVESMVKQAATGAVNKFKDAMVERLFSKLSFKKIRGRLRGRTQIPSRRIGPDQTKEKME